MSDYQGHQEKHTGLDWEKQSSVPKQPNVCQAHHRVDHHQGSSEDFK